MAPLGKPMQMDIEKLFQKEDQEITCRNRGWHPGTLLQAGRDHLQQGGSQNKASAKTQGPCGESL